MTKPLFYEQRTFIEKVAGEVDLPDDPNQWAQQILQELYKQVPYIADYQPHVQMSRVDAERGYGLGHVEIQNQTEAASDAPEDQLTSAGIRSVRIPFVVKDKRLSPFDLLINDTGSTIPLTESRLRQSLFRPQAFDVTSKTPGDQSMIGQLYPPYRQNYGFGGGGMSVGASGGFGKVAGAKHASVLEAILPTLDAHDAERMSDAVMDSERHLREYTKMASPRFAQAVSLVLAAKDSVKHASWEQRLAPNVAQVSRAESGYRVKTANSNYWEPEERMLDRGSAVREFGARAVLYADTTGSYTWASGVEKRAAKEEPSPLPQPIAAPGAYQVTDTDGNVHIGFATPTLVGADGQEVPLGMFTNGSVIAVQEGLLGMPAGQVTLPSGPLGRVGAFYTDEGGAFRVTVPFELTDSVAYGNSPRMYSGTTFDGNPVQVCQQAGLPDISVGDNGELIVPGHWKWLPLDKAAKIEVPAAEQPTAEDVQGKVAHVEVIGDGITFSLRGVPLAKFASAESGFLNVDEALFMLAGLGVPLQHGAQKLAQAAATGAAVPVKIARVITKKSDVMRESMDKAAGIVSSMQRFSHPILLKEAAAFPDPQMVDTVLSLGFITPENITTFVSYLPDIEDVQVKLCELLFAVRLGLSNVPQSALERAVRSVEEVIEGLKVLGFQGS